MVYNLIGRDITLVRRQDQNPIVGRVDAVEMPIVKIVFDCGTPLKVGDEIECGVGNGVSYARLVGQVVSVGESGTELWMTTQHLVPGTDRAPRAVSSGLVGTLATEDSESTVTICDISESGLRVAGLDCPRIGQQVTILTEIQGGQVKLDCRVARINQRVKNEQSEVGLQILDADRLSRARWNHLVSSLLRKHGIAA